MAQKLDSSAIIKTLTGAVSESIQAFLKTPPDKAPVVVTKPLYAGDKLEFSAYGEFADASYISVVYLHAHPSDKGTRRHCGMLILYVSTSAINHLVKSFGFKNATQAGMGKSMDAVAQLCNNIAGVFKKGISGLGYPEIETGTPLKFKGFFNGLDYPKREKHYHRLTAFVWGQIITLDIILSL